MKSVFHQTDRLALSHRLDAVTSASTARWGLMDCRQMLAHLSESAHGPERTDAAASEGTTAAATGSSRDHYCLPFPKGAPTAPELLVRRAEDFDAERAALKHLLQRLGAMEGAASGRNIGPQGGGARRKDRRRKTEILLSSPVLMFPTCPCGRAAPGGRS